MKKLRFAVQHLEEAVSGSDRSLAHPQCHADRAKRAGQHQHVDVEGGELAEVKVAAQDLVAADQQNQGSAELGQGGDQRREEGLDPGRANRLVKQAVNRALEALELVILASERLDHADSGNALLGLGGELGDPLGHLLHRRARLTGVAERGEHDQRSGGQGDQREPGIDHEHDHARQQHGKQALAEEDQAVTEEEADRLQVDRGPAHQLAGLVAVEETKLEAHQVGVDLLAKIELDRQRDPAGDDPSDHREPEPQDRGKEDRPDQPEELLPVTAVDRVGGLADQGRDQHRHAHRQPGKDHGTPELAAMGPQESQKSPEGGHPLHYTK